MPRARPMAHAPATAMTVQPAMKTIPRMGIRSDGSIPGLRLLTFLVSPVHGDDLRDGPRAVSRGVPSRTDNVVQTPGSRARKREVQPDEAVQDGRLAHIGDRPERHFEVHHEVRNRHLAREQERDRSREQAEHEQDAAGELEESRDSGERHERDRHRWKYGRVGGELQQLVGAVQEIEEGSDNAKDTQHSAGPLRRREDRHCGSVSRRELDGCHVSKNLLHYGDAQPMISEAETTEPFVRPDSIVRRIWGDADVVMVIFAGAAAEFGLNAAVDWLFVTGDLPRDPIGRFFSTAAYAQRIAFGSRRDAESAFAGIRAAHAAVEKRRGSRIPAWAHRDALYLLIAQSELGFEVLHRALTRPKRDDLYDVFHRVGEGLGIPDLPAT